MPDDWWNHLYCIDRKEDRSFLTQTLGRPTDASRETLLEQFRKFSEERELTMSIDNGIRCNFTSFDSADKDIRGHLTDLLTMPNVSFTSSNITYDDCATSFVVTIEGCNAHPYASPKRTLNPLKIKNVIFNNPATIVFWGDGTKTVVKCENEEFDKEKGLAMAYMKKMLGNNGRYFNEVKKWTR